MLKEVLSAVESSAGPINLVSLGKELNIEPGALAGMVEFWQRKGKLTISRIGENGFVYQGGTCSKCSEILACSGKEEIKKTCKF